MQFRCSTAYYETSMQTKESIAIIQIKLVRSPMVICPKIYVTIIIEVSPRGSKTFSRIGDSRAGGMILKLKLT
jgi:hypothetical protein